jgi:hypothetical protein
MTPRAKHWIAWFALATILSGCSAATSGEPVPLTTPPPVPHPLDLASHSGDPCALLTHDDYATLGLVVDQGGKYPTKFGNPKIESVCFTQDHAETKSLDLELYFQVNLLDSAYLELRHNGGQPLNGSSINGYPAILDSKPSDPKLGPANGCVVMIATSAHQSIQLHYKTAAAADQAASCTLLTELAGRVLQRLGA